MAATTRLALDAAGSEPGQLGFEAGDFSFLLPAQLARMAPGVGGDVVPGGKRHCYRGQDQIADAADV